MLHQRNKTRPCSIDTEQIVVSGDGARRRLVETGDVCVRGVVSLEEAGLGLEGGGKAVEEPKGTCWWQPGTPGRDPGSQLSLTTWVILEEVSGP